jgi:hypothetical protein
MSVKNAFQAVRKTKGWYRGLGVALNTQPVFWGFYYPTYTHLQNRWNEDNNTRMTVVNSLIGGAVGATGSNPLWVIRTRLQTSVQASATQTSVQASAAQTASLQTRTGYLETVKTLYREGGTKAFFRGLNVTLTKNIQMAFLFPIFEKIKGETPLQNFAAGCAAKMISSTLVYPMDVVRTNMRHHQSASVRFWDEAKRVYNRGSHRSLINFYRGLTIYWMSALPTFGIMVMMKELLS